MEKRNILAAFAIAAAACGSFAEPKQYFGVKNFDGAPTPPFAGSEYYDEPLGGGHFHELTFQEWFYAPHALANMYGARRYAENNGIVPTAAYLGNFASNVSGGMSRRGEQHKLGESRLGHRPAQAHGRRVSRRLDNRQRVGVAFRRQHYKKQNRQASTYSKTTARRR